MPQVQSEPLVQAIASAIAASGFAGILASPVRRQPRHFILSGPNAPTALSVYAWTLTFGGRPSLPNEFRIQMTSVESPLAVAADGPTLLLGYEPTHNLFAGFDLQRHRTFTTGSPSVQIDINALRQAELEGLSFHRKSNSEIAIGIRPDLFMAYAMNAAVLHRLGRNATTVALLSQAMRDPAAPPPPTGLATERRRLIAEVSLLARDAAFRRRIMFAYGDRCAVTRSQLRLVDAAHILPVGAAGSTDAVQNGMALSPTYHRAFDAGLIYLSEQFEMRLNEARIRELQGLNLAGGLVRFREPLGRVILPPDSLQHPSVELIRRANRFRQIPS